jgi:DNA-binding NtrC family response regulator
VEMKKILADIIQGKPVSPLSADDASVFHADAPVTPPIIAGYGLPSVYSQPTGFVAPVQHAPITHHEVVVEERLSLEDQERDLIIKALEKHRGRRKNASIELGISERTLYRKIKEYDINL